MSILPFKQCKTEEEIAFYFVRQNPEAKFVKDKWLPKLGIVYVDTETGYETKLQAMVAAKKYHTMCCQKLNLKPLYN